MSWLNPILVSLTVTAMCMGCAHEQRKPTSTHRPYSYQEGDPLHYLEQELNSKRPDPQTVTVPAALLRALVQNERLLRGQCAEMSTQLRALKDIDSGETEAWK